MAKKGDGPKTGKIPIDYVSLDYFQGSYKYTVRFATQSTDSQSLTIVTYLIGADGTHSPALSYYKSKSKAQDAIVDTGVTNRLWAGHYLTVAFSDANNQESPATRGYSEPLTIDDPFALKGGPKTGKIPIDGIALPDDPVNDGMSIVLLDLDTSLGTAGEVIPVDVYITMNDGTNPPVFEHLESDFVIPDGAPGNCDHNAGSFNRLPGHTCDVRAYTQENSSFMQRRTRYVIPGMT